MTIIVDIVKYLYSLATTFFLSLVEKKKNDKKANMNDMSWIRGLRGQEQNMSSLALEWEPFA